MLADNNLSNYKLYLVFCNSSSEYAWRVFNQQLHKRADHCQATLESAASVAEQSSKNIEEIIAWLKDMKSVLSGKMARPLPDDVPSINAMLKEQIVRTDHL